MISETVMSALLSASITGAGLVLAVYALITPISDKIFKERAKKLVFLFEEFNKKSKITPDTSAKDFKLLKELRNEIRAVRNFPRYLGQGIVITFGLFCVFILKRCPLFIYFTLTFP